MVNVAVDPGICGLPSVIHAESSDMQTVHVTIDSECPSIKALEAELSAVEGYGVTFAKFSASAVYQAADKHFKHAACPVPAAIVKAVEVACNLALPKDVTFTITRT
ncbi:MAG: hypothetical protein HZC28_00405 [Spirochaetes bacterium]|nr:hypothetical protein [Spirochaetota bacterium]